MLNPFSRSTRERDGFPVFPGAFPVVGHIPAVYRGLPDLERRARDELGPMFWIIVGPMAVLMCTGAEALEIFRDKAFSSAHLPKIAPLVAGQSMLSHDGATHRHMRSAMSGSFSPRGLSASAVGPRMARSLASLAARWAEARSARALPEVQETALAIFDMIGVDIGELPAWREKYRALLLANLGIPVMFPGSPAWRSKRAKAWIDERLLAIISSARARPDGETLVCALANAKDDGGAPLTDEELLDNLRLLVLGGHETVSSMMAWITIELAHRPEHWDALVAEAQRASRVPETPEEVRAFPFAEAMFRETLRIHPPFVNITRVAGPGATHRGRAIPEGSLVGIDLYSASRDASIYAGPDDFKPSRWIGRSGPPSATEIAQFGAGAHFCLGYHLAWLEAVQFQVALAREMASRGLRPRLRGEAPKPIFVPTEHPPPATRVDFV